MRWMIVPYGEPQSGVLFKKSVSKAAKEKYLRKEFAEMYHPIDQQRTEQKLKIMFKLAGCEYRLI